MEEAEERERKEEEETETLRKEDEKKDDWDKTQVEHERKIPTMEVLKAKRERTWTPVTKRPEEGKMTKT